MHRLPKTKSDSTEEHRPENRIDPPGSRATTSGSPCSKMERRRPRRRLRASPAGAVSPLRACVCKAARQASTTRSTATRANRLTATRASSLPSFSSRGACSAPRAVVWRVARARDVCLHAPCWRTQGWAVADSGVPNIKHAQLALSTNTPHLCCRRRPNGGRSSRQGQHGRPRARG